MSTDSFDIFMDENNLWEIALNNTDNQEILNHFMKARLSKEVIKSIKSFLKTINSPLAIRSSGLLEDSQYQPLADVFYIYVAKFI